VWLTALLDSGSPHNFMDLEVAAYAGWQSCRTTGGSHQWRPSPEPSVLPGLEITINNERYTLDCYELTLCSYTMVLRV
jgi:hypothetical protein